MIELLKTGKGKEVSYNALATHIIAEDGDNPEVGESREVFDLPVIKVAVHTHTARQLQLISFFCPGLLSTAVSYSAVYLMNAVKAVLIPSTAACPSQFIAK